MKMYLILDTDSQELVSACNREQLLDFLALDPDSQVTILEVEHDREYGLCSEEVSKEYLETLL